MKKKISRFSAAFLAVILVFNLYAQPKAKAIGAEAIAVGIVASAAAIYFVASGLSTEATGMTPESFKKAMEESVIGEFCEAINTTIVQLATPFLESIQIDERRPGVIGFGAAIAGTLYDLIQFAIQKFQLNSAGDTATVATNEYIEMLNGEKLYIGSDRAQTYYNNYNSTYGGIQITGFNEKPQDAIYIGELLEKVNNWEDEIWNNISEYKISQIPNLNSYTRENTDGILWETTIGTDTYTLGYKYIKTKDVYTSLTQTVHSIAIILMNSNNPDKNVYITDLTGQTGFNIIEDNRGGDISRWYGSQKYIEESIPTNKYIFPIRWMKQNQNQYDGILFGVPYYPRYPTDEITNTVEGETKYLLTGQYSDAYMNIMGEITGITTNTGMQQDTVKDASLSFTREEDFSITQPQEGQQIAIDTGMDFGDEDDTQTILDGALGAILAGTADFTATTETQATETDWDEAPTVDEAYEADPGDQPGGDIEPGDLIGLLSGGAFASIWHYVLELLAYGADGIDAIKAVFNGLPYAVKLPYYASLAVMLIFGILLRILI